MSTTPSSAKTLSGKLALVTGGSRGIGAAISRHLAALGATVLVNYAKSRGAADALAADIRSAGHAAHAIGGDVSDAKQVDAIFTAIDRDHGGKLDILVNNAGIYL